jgi:hypothetical protein
MNAMPRRWKVRTLGLMLLTVLTACTVTGDGYVGGVYESPGYEYGGWGPGYHVGPPRGGERRREQPSPRAYRPAPPSRGVPSLPARPHGH